MNELYPLRFQPRFKEKIWGGSRIRSVYSFEEAPSESCGEAWLISGVASDPSIVSNGHYAGNELNELVEVFMGDLVGDKVYEECGDEFPILLKIIDAQDWLSIQVHPDDELAMKRYGTHGKSEMWYILDALPGSELISGFNRPMDREAYVRHLKDKNLSDVLNHEKVSKGDVFHMPAGRIHALGPGVMLAEVQQTSDITYRIHDWDRVGADGQPREMHISEALDAIDFSKPDSYRTVYPAEFNASNSLVDSKHFSTNLLSFDQILSKDYSGIDSFVIYLCIEGSMILSTGPYLERLHAGEAILVPNTIQSARLQAAPVAKALEVFIR